MSINASERQNKCLADFDQIPAGSFLAELSDSQKAAIKYSLEPGKVIQARFPEIADDYKCGMTQDEILEKYKIGEIFSLGNISTARMAVSNALRGYDGGMGLVTDIAAYPGLIAGRVELANIAKDHRVAGIVKQLDQKKGIHGQTATERRTVGRLGAIAIGGNPFTDKEETLMEELAASPDYRHKSRINAGRIAEEINVQLHNGETVRTAKQVVKRHCRISKRKSGT